MLFSTKNYPNCKRFSYAISFYLMTSNFVDTDVVYHLHNVL